MTTAATPVEHEEPPVSPKPEEGTSEQQQQPQPKKGIVQPSSKVGCLAGLFQVINSPWLLTTVPLILAGMYLLSHPEIITNNLNKPYALLAGPVFVASLLTGWLIFKFFRTIEAWCKLAGRAFFRARKEDGSAQFFWMVIIVFMIVSVFASGSFFTMLEHDVLPGLGYATALFIDLVAVQSMRARLNAVRMHDRRGALLYLIGVFVCAGASAFANVYSDLANFTQHATGVLPAWMVNVAPWFGLVFPALILLLSITADYTLDQTSTKLDPDNYKAQEEKRIRLIEIQRDMLTRRVQVEQEIDRLSQQQSLGKQERVFFLISWLFPKQPANVQQVAAEVTTHMQGEINKQLQALCTYLIGQIGQAYSANVGQIQAIQGNLQQIELEFNLLLQERQKTEHFVTHPTPIGVQKASNSGQNAEFNPHEIPGQPGKKSLSFTPNTFHKKALEFIQNHPEWRSTFEDIVRTHPRTGFEDIATFIRRQPGMNFAMITGQFVAEVLSLLQVKEEASGQSELAARGAQSGKMRVSQETGREQVNTVKAPVVKREVGEQEVNIQNGSEPGEHLQVRQAQSYTDGTPPARQANNQGYEGQQTTTIAPDLASDDAQQCEDSAVNSEAVSSAKRARITRQLALNTAFDTHEIQSEINGEFPPSFGPNNEYLQTATPTNSDKISTPSVGYTALNLAAASAEDEANFAKGNRGPYHMLAREIADQYQCSLEQVQFAVEQNMIRVSGRTNRETDPVAEWKILISSLEGFVPPQLPKKRGRKRVLEPVK